MHADRFLSVIMLALCVTSVLALPHETEDPSYKASHSRLESRSLQEGAKQLGTGSASIAEGLASLIKAAVDMFSGVGGTTPSPDAKSKTGTGTTPSKPPTGDTDKTSTGTTPSKPPAGDTGKTGTGTTPSKPPTGDTGTPGGPPKGPSGPSGSEGSTPAG